MSGTLTYENFKHFARDFVDISSELQEGWCLQSMKLSTTEVFVTKRTTIYDTKLNDEGCEDCDPEFHTYDYHIIYSHSYSVPVLYFNACRPNGSLLKLEELWERVPDTYKQQINENKWSMLTQQEHPMLGIPYFVLHPCHTSDFMSSVMSVSGTRTNYLIPWLSVVGPLVGLKLSPLFAVKMANRAKEN